MWLLFIITCTCVRACESGCQRTAVRAEPLSSLEVSIWKLPFFQHRLCLVGLCFLCFSWSELLLPCQLSWWKPCADGRCLASWVLPTVWDDFDHFGGVSISLVFFMNSCLFPPLVEPAREEVSTPIHLPLLLSVYCLPVRPALGSSRPEHHLLPIRKTELSFLQESGLTAYKTAFNQPIHLWSFLCFISEPI